MQTVVFLAFRATHVFLAAIWFGSTVFISELLVPALDAAGPAGGQVMGGLNRRVNVYMAILGGTTVLTGIYLFWHFTGGFDPEISRSHAGISFGIGGVCGLLAVIIGGAVIGRSSRKMLAVMEQMPKASAAQKAALMQEADALRGRMKTFGSLVLLLQIIALLTMALGHYV